MQSDFTNIFEPIIKSLPKLKDNSQEKASLLVILIHRLTHYQKIKKLNQVGKQLKKMFDTLNGVIPKDPKTANAETGAKQDDEEMKDEEEEKEDSLKTEMMSSFYNFVTIF